MTVDHGQSIRVDCDNCGDRGEPTGEKARNSMDESVPVLNCPTCHAAWTTTESRVLGLFIADSTPARGVDQWAVEQQGYYPSEWAELTDRDESTVTQNIPELADNE